MAGGAWRDELGVLSDEPMRSSWFPDGIIPEPERPRTRVALRDEEYVIVPGGQIIPRSQTAADAERELERSRAAKREADLAEREGDLAHKLEHERAEDERYRAETPDGFPT
jgi:hypothetical protein